MSNAKRQKDKVRLPPFAPIMNDEMTSLAYRDLSNSAGKAYPHFKRFDGIKRKLSGPGSSFDFTYSEAEKLGFSRSTFAKIISDLSAKGFLNIVEHGGKRGCGFSNSKYQLSERWRDYGRTEFLKKPRHPSEPIPCVSGKGD